MYEAPGYNASVASRDEHEEIAPSARRALIALGVVVAISIAMICGVLVLAKNTTDRAKALADNSLRSAQILSDLRHQLHHLQEAPVAARPVIEARLALDLAAYQPLATGPGEAAEWATLRRLLGLVVAAPAKAPETAVRFEQLEGSLERLAESNVRIARWKVDRIGEAQRDGLIAQVIAALITLICAGVVATVLNRVMRRQRGLIRRDLQSLQDRNRELAEFARRTAHDLRQPLGPIHGYADLLVEGAAVDVKFAASKIRSSADRMSEIIGNLLALSVSGQLPAGSVNVPPLVRTTIEDMRAELADADVRVDVDECKAACAPSVLAQLLHNVLTNASKYREPQRHLMIQIVVRAHGADIELTISDNGIGMTPDVVAHAFDPTYRASGVGAIPGHGLGLAIVKRTIDAIGGSCSLKSWPHHGSEIVIHLPAAS
jgi:signal transduction histidine kinase